MRCDRPARKITLVREMRSSWKKKTWIGGKDMLKLNIYVRELQYQLRHSLGTTCCCFPMINWFFIANSRLILVLPWVFSLFKAISYSDDFGGDDALVVNLISAIGTTPRASWLVHLKRHLHGGSLAGGTSDNTYGWIFDIIEV